MCCTVQRQLTTVYYAVTVFHVFLNYELQANVGEYIGGISACRQESDDLWWLAARLDSYASYAGCLVPAGGNWLQIHRRGSVAHLAKPPWKEQLRWLGSLN